ncbi:MAG: hypothetical protein ACR2OC_13220 [Solirubrobacterales bacterium]
MRILLVLASIVALSAPLIALASKGPAPTRAPSGVSKPEATCFWEGPISTKRPTTRGFDGRNFNFPEESATYWLARFTLPEGNRLVLRGRYPHGRYMSLNAYSEGNPTDALSDIRIEPEPRSGNPFARGAKRDIRKREWEVEVVNETPPAAEAREPNTLYAQPAGGASIELAYRVYEPDPGLDLTGGAGLPEVELTGPGTEGTVTGDTACEQINDPNREITVQTVPAALWQGARNSPGCDGATNPAYDPPRWERFFNIDFASLAVITDCTEAGRQGRLAMRADLEGGFYSNRDSAYIFQHMSRDFGPVMVVEGTLPRFPRTYREPKRMPRGEVRFWSLCTGESRVTARTPDCLADRQVLKQSGREYTVVVSRAADRPANANKACGVAWLDWGEGGDGAGDSDYGVLIMRNMLVSPGFEQAIQRVPQPGQEEAVMGPHFPRSQYMTGEEFAAKGCD